jgi:ABC-type glycerol-3-phosphate transport system substrate-binding protein
VGGDHLVIWKNANADAAIEKAAMDLLRYLSDRDTQLQYFKFANALPARLDAYQEMDFSLATSAETIQKILETGRPHPPVRLWRRIETFLDEMLLDIGNMVLRQPLIPASEITKRMLDDYEEKLFALLKK